MLLSAPQRHCCVQTSIPWGSAPCADRAARVEAGLTFTTIITPQGACQSLCSAVIKTSTLGRQGGFPSVAALLRVGRSLIHGSVLQPSHDRWVSCRETQDMVTHGIVPAAQGGHSPSQHPKLGYVPLAAAACPKSCPVTTSWGAGGAAGAASVAFLAAPWHCSSKELGSHHW